MSCLVRSIPLTSVPLNLPPSLPCVRLFTLLFFVLSSAKVRGDHYVTMKVAIPRDVSADERKLLEELQEKSGGKIKGSKNKNKGNKVNRVGCGAVYCIIRTRIFCPFLARGG